jgi:Domain of unknown function (DUF4189)
MRRLSVLLASAVMALTLIAFAVATGVSAAPKQQQPPPNNFYGALYIGDVSQTQSAVYWETGTSEASAKQAALNTCEQQATNCQLLVWVYNGWVALFQGTAQGGNNTLFYRWDRTEQAAVAGAMKNCQANATGCEQVGTWKTAFDPNKQTNGGFK